MSGANLANHHDVFLAGPMSGVRDAQLIWVRSIYSNVATTCQQLRLTCFAYHNAAAKDSATDQVVRSLELGKRAPQSDLYLDKSRILKNSTVVVAYVGLPAIGVGVEIEMARRANIPVILLCEQENAYDISGLVLGTGVCHDLVTFPFEHPELMAEPLAQALCRIFSAHNLEEAARRGSWSDEKLNSLNEALNRQLRLWRLEPAAERYRMKYRIFTLEDWCDSTKCKNLLSIPNPPLFEE